MNMKILIVDDEQLARTRLRYMAEKMAGFEVVAEASNGLNAITEVNQYEPDIVLMDIRMPGMDGLEAASHISKLESPPAIIFTTAYNDYALQAFNCHAINYLLKPIRKEQLESALNVATKLNRAQTSALITSENKSNEPQHISVRQKGNIVLIPSTDIFYFLAEHKYVTIGHKEGEALTEEPLTVLENQFPVTFVRVHRNALVAIKQIYSLEKNKEGTTLIRLRDCDKPFEVSRRLLPSVRKLVKNHK
jgi:two-component system response regulator AlgR